MYPLTNKKRNNFLKNNINVNNQIKPKTKPQIKKDIPEINSNSLINTSIELSNKKNKMNNLKTEFYWESLNQKYPYNPQKKYCIFFNGCCCPPHRGHINAIREAFKTWPNCKVIINQLGSSGRHGVPSAFNSYLLQKYLSDVFGNSANIEYMFRESSRTIFSHDFVTDSDVVVIIRGEEFDNSDDINEVIAEKNIKNAKRFKKYIKRLNKQGIKVDFYAQTRPINITSATKFMEKLEDFRQKRKANTQTKDDLLNLMGFIPEEVSSEDKYKIIKRMLKFKTHV